MDQPRTNWILLGLIENVLRFERPVNVDRSNLVWIDVPDVHRTGPRLTGAPRIAFLWGEFHTGKLNGTLLKLGPRYHGEIRSSESGIRVVVIRGNLQYKSTGDVGGEFLQPGSGFSSDLKSEHDVLCDDADGCILYIRSDGKYIVS